MLPLRWIDATQLWKVEQTFVSYDGHTSFSIRLVLAFALAFRISWTPVVPLLRDEARVVLRPLLRREPVLALSFPFRSWTLSCKVSLLTAVVASLLLAFAFFSALTLALALSFAGADIVSCGLLSFLLYFSLFLRIRFTRSAQPHLVRVISPRLCVHVNWLLLVVVIRTVCHGVEVLNCLPILLINHGQRLQEFLLEFLIRALNVTSHGCALQQVFHNVDGQYDDQKRFFSGHL